MKQPELIAAQAYGLELIQQLSRAKNRVAINAMTVLSGSIPDQVFSSLVQLVDRGVEVHLIFDSYSKLRLIRGELFTKRIRDTIVNLDILQDHGAQVTFLGKTFPNPYAGRSHTKITIIDDHTYTFGGINLKDASFHYVDYMLHYKDKMIADYVWKLLKKIENNQKPANFQHRLDAQSVLLFDGSAKGSSIIYDVACKLASEAKTVCYVSKMCPTGELAKIIKTTDYRCYFNNPKLNFSLTNATFVLDKVLYGITNSYQRAAYLHAKYILFESRDGIKSLISGSHNFNWRGVAYGTEEIALYSTDEHLWNVLKQFTKNSVDSE